MQIGRKAPSPLLPFGEILRLNRCDIHTFTHHTSCIIDHPIRELAEKPPPQWPNKETFFRLNLSISCDSSNFGSADRKAPPPPKDEGNFFYTGSIHFRQFEQFWFLWQKSPPPSQDEGIFFLHWIYPFQAILSNFGSAGRKAPSPKRGNFFTLDLSISGNFEQLGFCGRKAPPPSKMRKFLFFFIFTLDVSISGNFEQLWFL